MKYIDAEKLKTIIEERKTQQDQWVERYHDPINQGISNELAEILSLIDSFQQEQSSLPSNLDEAAEEFYPDFSDSITSKAAVDSMRDAFKAGAEWIVEQFQQEQPEVDLEKEIESYLDGFIKTPTRTYFRDAIKHFYELGFNARKEE